MLPVVLAILGGAITLAVAQTWAESRLKQGRNSSDGTQSAAAAQPTIKQLSEPRPGGAPRGTQFEASLWRQAKKLSSKLRK